MIEVIQKNWLEIFLKELESTNTVYLISPFITRNIVDHLLKASKGKSNIKLITRYNLNDFRSKVSSLSALKCLVENGAEVKGIKNLHSKVYIFDNKSTIVGSANFTSGGFFNNYEFGLKSTNQHTANKSLDYFHSLWNISTELLTKDEIAEWDKKIKDSKSVPKNNELPDFGKKASIQGGKNQKCIIKIFGKTDSRVDLNFTSKDEIERSHCHWALTFSGKRGRYQNGRPRKYNNGDIVYMARMLEGRDYAIFGKGIALKHVDTRDVASIEDKAEIPWKSEWPVYIRVHTTEFINGKMNDCPKLSELINILKYDSFSTTQEYHNDGIENINVWDSLRQQADIVISEIAAEWLENKFQEAKAKHGAVPTNYLNGLYQGTPTLTDILKGKP